MLKSWVYWRVPLFFVMYPLSLVWRLIYFLRRQYKEVLSSSVVSFHVPVISVGNLSFGGTGKTPLTLWIADYLWNELHKSPLVVTRGYKGALEYEYGLLEASQTNELTHRHARQFGDEAIIMAQNLECGFVAVGSNRKKSIFRVLSEQKTLDYILMDDGLQYLDISKDCNLCLFDTLYPHQLYHPFPWGGLREPLSLVSRADAIVLTRVDLAGTESVGKLKELLRPYMRKDSFFVEVQQKIVGIYNIDGDCVLRPDQLAGTSVILCSAIGRPRAFRGLIEKAGAQIQSSHEWRDHYGYKDRDIRKLESLLDSHENCYLLTTEKDIVKLKGRSWHERLLFVKLGLEITEGESAFKDLLKGYIHLSERV